MKKRFPTKEKGGQTAAQLITPRGEEPWSGRPQTPPARVQRDWPLISPG